MKNSQDKQGVLVILILLLIITLLVIYLLSKTNYTYGIGEEINRSYKCYEKNETLYCKKDGQSIIVDWYREGK